MTPWAVAHQAPLSMGFSRPEYWSGLPFPSPGNLPDPGTEPRSPELQADSLPSEPPGEPHSWVKRLNLPSLDIKHFPKPSNLGRACTTVAGAPQGTWELMSFQLFQGEQQTDEYGFYT